MGTRAWARWEAEAKAGYCRRYRLVSVEEEVEVSIRLGPGEAGKRGAGEGEDSLEPPECSEEGWEEWEGEEEGVAQPEATCRGSR